MITPNRPRGGVRQRLQTDTVHPAIPGPLHRSLRRDWGSGRLSSAQVQEYALGANDQGANGLERLARMGASGEHASNLFRDINKYVRVAFRVRARCMDTDTDGERAIDPSSCDVASRVL